MKIGYDGSDFRDPPARGGKFAFPKKPRQTSQDYLAWIRSQPSVVSGKHPCEAAHLHSRGAWGSDYSAIPLTHEEHQEWHRKGQDSFEYHWKMNAWKEAWRLVTRYFTEENNGEF